MPLSAVACFLASLKNLHVGATFVVKLRIQDLFATVHNSDSGIREKWDWGGWDF